MKFVENISKKEYTEFYNKFKDSHFLQSTAWGQAMEETRGKKTIYVGLKDDKDKLVATALLLKKEMPFGLCYYYCSRGYLIDFKNKELVKTFTEEMKKYLKKTNAIYVKINPELMYQEIDDNGEKVEGGKNNYDVFNHLLSLGYKHQGFVKLHENNEPRYTFRRFFKNYKTKEELDASINKSFMSTVKRSFAYDLKINFDANVDNFHRLNKENAERNGFVQYSDNFYKKLYEYGSKEGTVKVFDVSVNMKKLYNDTKEDLDKTKELLESGKISKKQKPDTIDKINRLENGLKIFEEYKDSENEVVCSLINGIANKKMWTMYIGNNKLGEYLMAVNRVYYETIHYCFENGYEFLDVYGTVGDPKTTYRNLGGLHSFKKKFGETYIEFIGEFDLVNKPLLYTVLPMLLKIYRKIKK